MELKQKLYENYSKTQVYIFVQKARILLGLRSPGPT